jgi:hypothetical protein
VAGSFLVAEADDDDGSGAVLQDAERGRVHAVDDAPELTAGEALTGELVADDPTGTVWRVAETSDRWTVRVAESAEPPTANSREAASEAVGDLVRVERAGEGELHVITVPEDGTEAAVADVLDDETGLRTRAARLGVRRVEVRSAPGVVVVRYLP